MAPVTQAAFLLICVHLSLCLLPPKEDLLPQSIWGQRCGINTGFPNLFSKKSGSYFFFILSQFLKFRWGITYIYKTAYMFKILLFLERGTRRGRETSMCGCLSHTPSWGLGPQSRHVPWLGIKPATRWFTGWRSIPWATPARAVYIFKCTVW